MKVVLFFYITKRCKFFVQKMKYLVLKIKCLFGLLSLGNIKKLGIIIEEIHAHKKKQQHTYTL